MNKPMRNRDSRRNADRYRLEWSGLWVYDEGIAPAQNVSPSIAYAAPSDDRNSRVTRRQR